MWREERLRNVGELQGVRLSNLVGLIIISIVIGSTALRGPWSSSEASASWSIRLLLLQISWQIFPQWGCQPHAISESYISNKNNLCNACFRMIYHFEYRRAKSEVVAISQYVSSVFKMSEHMVPIRRSQWPRGLRRRSAAAWLLGSRVQIPLRAWMFVCCVYMLCCPV
jgi:hypothetical protein